MSPLLTAKRRAILRDAAERAKLPNAAINSPYHAGFEAVAWRKNAEWLAARLLLRPYHHGGWIITAEGMAALRLPFGSQDEAHQAVADWKRHNRESVFPIGWAALRCKGGGWAVRMGFAKGSPILLPDGIDKELIR